MVMLAVASASLGWAATLEVGAGHTYAKIQSAVNAAKTGDVVVVAEGKYKENIDFKGKAITVQSTTPTPPSIVATTIIDGGKRGSVVRLAAFETATSVLTGFTLTCGTGTDDSPYCLGGGVYCYYASPTLTHNVISGNSAGPDGYGGGVYCISSSPTLTNNTISGNSATEYGSGVYCLNSSPTISNNTISGNSVSGNGAGVYSDASSPTIVSNTISGNHATGWGGGVDCGHNGGTPIIYSNIISRNTCGISGGGISMGTSVNADIVNNTISGNSAGSHGGGIYCTGTSATLSDKIIAFSAAGGGLYVDIANGASATVRYCDFYSNTGGDYVNWADPTGTTGNISKDLLFANAGGGNFRLKSQGGRWNGTAWVLDAVSSPCLDAGDPAFAFSLEPAPNGGRINVGFDGDTIHASKTPPPTVTAWSPTGTAAPITANLTVTFGTGMNRTSANNALTVNGVKASTFGGVLSWSGNKLTFTPTRVLMMGKSYKIVVGTGAKSAVGVNLAKAFTWLP